MEMPLPPCFFPDICNVDPSCGFGSWRPAFRDRRAADSDVDIDMAFILDSSESTTLFQFNEMKKYIGYLVRQLDMSPDPRASRHLARVAVVQHAPYASLGNSSVPPARVELSLTDYGSKDKLLDFLGSRMTQLQGTRALGSAIEYTIENVFESAPHPRDLKIVVLMLTGEVREPQLQEVRRAILQAKCRGYFFVVLGIGGKVNVEEVYSFASEPHDVFFKLVGQPAELSEEPLMRFGRLLPSFVGSKSWPTARLLPAGDTPGYRGWSAGCGVQGPGTGVGAAGLGTEKTSHVLPSTRSFTRQMHSNAGRVPASPRSWVGSEHTDRHPTRGPSFAQPNATGPHRPWALCPCEVSV